MSTLEIIPDSKAYINVFESRYFEPILFGLNKVIYLVHICKYLNIFYIIIRMFYIFMMTLYFDLILL